MKQISRTELWEKLERHEDIKLAFALGEWPYRALHIPGSLYLPCPPDLYASDAALEGLDRDDEIVVYCSGEVCYASVATCQYLVSRGYRNVRRYAGGLEDWVRGGYPLVGEAAAR